MTSNERVGTMGTVKLRKYGYPGKNPQPLGRIRFLGESRDTRMAPARKNAIEAGNVFSYIRLVASWFLLCLIAFVSGCAHQRETVPPPQPRPALPKSVLIDKKTQTLSAYEGDQLVFTTRVSTGKFAGSTPNGRFRAGVKDRMHYSSLYDNAPMPYSVQVIGNCFIHGYSHVPNYPASHGCIRVPLSGDNPAKRFYEWVEPGTPIKITGSRS